MTRRRRRPGTQSSSSASRSSAGSSAFPVKLMREMVSQAPILPNDGEGKVYLLTHAENLSAAAQNTLLKLLEEPPAHLMIILCCDNRFKLLPTILSRVTPLTQESDEVPEMQQAQRVIELAAAGSRFELLKLLQSYEKDTAGFEELLRVAFVMAVKIAV